MRNERKRNTHKVNGQEVFFHEPTLQNKGLSIDFCPLVLCLNFPCLTWYCEITQAYPVCIFVQ